MNKMLLKFSAISQNEAFARTSVAAFLLPLSPTLSEINDIKTAVSEAALVDRVNLEDGLEYIPRILLELLVTEAQATVVSVNLKNLNVEHGTDLCELRGMLDLLGPREVAHVDKAIYTLLDLNEDTEVGEVAYLGCVLRAYRILGIDTLPRIGLELLDTE